MHDFEGEHKHARHYQAENIHVFHVVVQAGVLRSNKICWNLAHAFAVIFSEDLIWSWAALCQLDPITPH